jgi:hypothetical protein
MRLLTDDSSTEEVLAGRRTLHALFGLKSTDSLLDVFAERVVAHVLEARRLVKTKLDRLGHIAVFAEIVARATDSLRRAQEVWCRVDAGPLVGFVDEVRRQRIREAVN